MTLMRLQRDDPSRIGRYLLTARLGAGGMGIVYLGKADDGRQVAVKVLRPEHADDPETRKRFKREATAIARVRSPHAVQVLDADPDCSTPYLATEFADGPSLEDHVKTYGPLHPEALVRLASALAGALDAIHSADVTHRDLKPSNVLLTNTGPKVIDFGIARVANTVPITKTGMTIGSPGYMAPEQVSGHSGQKSDIFAWALVLAFAASGRPPFGTGPALTVLHRIIDGPPDVSAVPPGLMPLVTKAIAGDPERRPTAAELLRELSSDPADLVTLADLAGAGAAEPGTGTVVSSGSRRGWRAAAVAVPVVALMVAAEVLLAQSGVQPGAHPPGHASPRPAVARTPVARAGDADPSGGPGSVAGSGVPRSPSGSVSPSGSPHPASSPVTSHPVSSLSSGPPSPSSTAPSPSSAAPSTAPASSPPPSSPPPSSPSPSSTPPSSAAPSSANPSVSSSGSGSAAPSATSS